MSEYKVCSHITVTVNEDGTDTIQARADAIRCLPDASMIHLMSCFQVGRDLQAATMTSLAERWDETGQDTDGERDRIWKLLKEGTI